MLHLQLPALLRGPLTESLLLLLQLLQRVGQMVDLSGQRAVTPSWPTLLGCRLQEGAQSACLLALSSLLPQVLSVVFSSSRTSAGLQLPSCSAGGPVPTHTGQVSAVIRLVCVCVCYLLCGFGGERLGRLQTS